MFKKKDKEILNNTRRIARGTTALFAMPDNNIISIFKKMEERKIKNPCSYDLPDYFTIKFINGNNDIYDFLGSFQEGDDCPKVYKSEFLKYLKKYKVNVETEDEETYKINRKQ